MKDEFNGQVGREIKIIQLSTSSEHRLFSVTTTSTTLSAYQLPLLPSADRMTASRRLVAEWGAPAAHVSLVGRLMKATMQRSEEKDKITGRNLVTFIWKVFWTSLVWISTGDYVNDLGNPVGVTKNGTLTVWWFHLFLKCKQTENMHVFSSVVAQNNASEPKSRNIGTPSDSSCSHVQLNVLATICLVLLASSRALPFTPSRMFSKRRKHSCFRKNSRRVLLHANG